MHAIYTTQLLPERLRLTVRPSNVGEGFALDIEPGDGRNRVTVAGLSVAELVDLVDGVAELLAQLDHESTLQAGAGAGAQRHAPLLER